ncbi:MAG: AraC family transcriptional regulator [SAR86 cluster bacterium]|uniref:AraC family transcriptional regulator n=1 Tax=SAR86 cluster bacterium TaxID=2030880 RepID=A0A2A5CHW6_9GAMM|nr:MAG: AraC family transcriptional regulator [SAR86 cluster bacterium]
MIKKLDNNKPQATYQQRMNLILDYIERHLDESLTLEKISQQANFSSYHFHRQFRVYTGHPAYKLIQLLRLKRAAKKLAFSNTKSITEIAFNASFENAESFSRAFKKTLKQTPRDFRAKPDWKRWNQLVDFRHINRSQTMQVKIINFPETMIAALEHHGPEHLTYNSSRQFIEWRQANGVKPGQGDTYGVHYSDPVSTLPEDYRLDICVSVEQAIAENSQGVVNKTIPAGRCAVVRHHGSRDYIPAADYLYREWLPESGEELRDYPPFFHYINVGPDIKDPDMITDIYLPIK